eukprot:c14983_g1_i2.p1 GENE.c14983_g1_i2~~c14983_g1_i2.p1  ORF type:complete len:463 (+),score=88.45 c14983_g1_i2:769-2157(+)
MRFRYQRAPLHPPGMAPAQSTPMSIPSLSCFQAQYNFQAVWVALVLMADQFPQSGWEVSLILSTTLAGCVHGQVIFGFLGDLIGRQRSLFWANGLCMLGAVLGATVTLRDSFAMYISASVIRFFLGLGVGGVDALAAVAAVETAPTGDVLVRRNRVGAACLWSVIGSVCPFVVAYLCHHLILSHTWLNYRIVFGVGALPALAALVLTWDQPEGREYEIAKQEMAFAHSARKSGLWYLLVGTSLSRLLFDSVYYGVALLCPALVQMALFDEDQSESAGVVLESADRVVWRVGGFNSVALIGVAVCMALFAPLGAKHQQFFGFLAIASACFLLCISVGQISGYGTFALVGWLAFTVSSGPRVTALLLPSEVFPPEVRATCSGLSAAAGSLGATLISFADYYLFDRCGLELLLVVYGFVAFLGAVVTWFLVTDIDRDFRYSIVRRNLSLEQMAIKNMAPKYTEFI